MKFKIDGSNVKGMCEKIIKYKVYLLSIIVDKKLRYIHMAYGD